MMDAGAAKLIGAGISVIALFGVGMGLGNLFSSLIQSIARNPSAKNEELTKDNDFLIIIICFL